MRSSLWAPLLIVLAVLASPACAAGTQEQHSRHSLSAAASASTLTLDQIQLSARTVDDEPTDEEYDKDFPEESWRYSADEIELGKKIQEAEDAAKLEDLLKHKPEAKPADAEAIAEPKLDKDGVTLLPLPDEEPVKEPPKDEIDPDLSEADAAPLEGPAEEDAPAPKKAGFIERSSKISKKSKIRTLHRVKALDDRQKRLRRYLFRVRRLFEDRALRPHWRRRSRYRRNHRLRTAYRYHQDNMGRVIAVEGYVGNRFRPAPPAGARSFGGVGYYSGMNHLMRQIYNMRLGSPAVYNRECGHIVADSLGGSPIDPLNFMSQTAQSNRGVGAPSNWYNQEMAALAIARSGAPCQGANSIYISISLAYDRYSLTPRGGTYSVSLSAACYNSIPGLGAGPSPFVAVGARFVRTMNWWN